MQTAPAGHTATVLGNGNVRKTGGYNEKVSLVRTPGYIILNRIHLTFTLCKSLFAIGDSTILTSQALIYPKTGVSN